MSDISPRRESFKSNDCIIIEYNPSKTWFNFIDYVDQTLLKHSDVLDSYGAIIEHYLDFSVIIFPNEKTRLLFEIRFG